MKPATSFSFHDKKYLQNTEIITKSNQIEVQNIKKHLDILKGVRK